jgi:hypothetical protein
MTSGVGGIFITYTARLAGVSHFVLERATTGRRRGHGCVVTTAQNRSGARCTRYVQVAVFTHRDRLGKNKVRLIAKVATRRLTVGTYRLKSSLPVTATIKDTFVTTLRIVAAPAPDRVRRAPRMVGWLAGSLGWLSAALTALL